LLPRCVAASRARPGYEGGGLSQGAYCEIGVGSGVVCRRDLATEQRVKESSVTMSPAEESLATEPLATERH
jgi:hypothetical protein